MWSRSKDARPFPLPKLWRIGCALSEMVAAPDPRCAVYGQFPPPDATVGVLTVPLKGYRYSCVQSVTNPAVFTKLNILTFKPCPDSHSPVRRKKSFVGKKTLERILESGRSPLNRRPFLRRLRLSRRQPSNSRTNCVGVLRQHFFVHVILYLSTRIGRWTCQNPLELVHLWGITSRGAEVTSVGAGG